MGGLTLAVFDFDGTLFRSPDPPPDWPGTTNWFVSEESLGEPYVPERPGPDWWVEPVVAQARASISNPDVWAIVVTGRPKRKSGFSYRVPELIHGKGLRFDDIYMNPGGPTPPFKKMVLKKMLDRYPAIDTVHFWEDMADDLRQYTQFVEGLGKVMVPHLVRAEAHPVAAEGLIQRVAARWLAGTVQA